MKNYCDPNLIFDYNDDKKEVYAKDIAHYWFLSHTMKDLTEESLQNWHNDWQSLILNPHIFHSYAQYLGLSSINFQSCTKHEKMLILWRFVKKNTYSTHWKMAQTKWFISAFVWQDVNSYKIEKNVNPKLKNYSTCMWLALIYKTLAREFLWVDGEIKSVLYHSYFKSNTGECVDYSEASIRWRKNGFFFSEEEYLERTATWMPKNKSIIDKTKSELSSNFAS